MTSEAHGVGRFKTLVVLVVGALLLSAVGPAPAFAQEPVPEVEVQFLVDGEQGNGFLIVTGTLPEDVSLPATLTLPVPEGASPTWIGEILNQGPENDIQREPVPVQTDHGLALSFSLEVTRTGQYEAIYLPTTVLESTREAVLEWTQTTPASVLVFSVRMPPGAQDVSIDPMPASGPARNDLGETLYILPSIESPEPGSSYVVEARYTPGSLLQDYQQSGVNTVLLLLGALVVILGAVLFVVLRRQGIGSVAGDADEVPPPPPTTADYEG